MGASMHSLLTLDDFDEATFEPESHLEGLTLLSSVLFVSSIFDIPLIFDLLLQVQICLNLFTPNEGQLQPRLALLSERPRGPALRLSR